MQSTHLNFNATESLSEPTVAPTPINPLPRAVLRANTYLLLDGEWRFAHDMADEGLAQNWQLGHDFAYTAPWPGSVEDHIAQAHQLNDGPGWQDKVVVWYERE